MDKQHRHKIFSVLTVACLSLTPNLFLAPNSWAQQSPEPETASLIKQLKSQNVQQRLDALHDLDNRIKYQKVKLEAVILAMIAALKDPSKDVRLQAAIVLGWIGAPAQSAVPTLINLLKHSNRDMRQEAANALGRILGHVGLSTPSTFIMRSDSDRDMWESATNALIKASDKDPDKLVQMEADSSLQNMGASPQGLWLGTNSIGCGGASSTK